MSDDLVLREGLRAADAEQRDLAEGVRRRVARNMLWTAPWIGAIGLLGGRDLLFDPIMGGMIALFAALNAHAWWRPLRHTYLLREDPTPAVLAAGGLPNGGDGAEGSPAQRRAAILELLDELESTPRPFPRWVPKGIVAGIVATGLLMGGFAGVLFGEWTLAAAGVGTGLGTFLLGRSITAAEARRVEAMTLLQAELDALPAPGPAAGDDASTKLPNAERG